MAFAGTGKIWMNGQFVEWKDANIHIASHVIHYGSGVFEGLRCYATPKGSAVFRLDDHMVRLLDSAKIYRMDYGLDLAGWREAQRKGWTQLYRKMNGSDGPALGDSVLDGIVTAIVVEHEQIGPRRYVARLGVQFDRVRAGQILGVSGRTLRSPPLLVIPVYSIDGIQQVFEQRDTPTDQGGDDPGLAVESLQMTIPGEGHEQVGTG